MTEYQTITIPHPNGATFVHPIRGKGTPEDVMTAIDNDNLLRPTSAQTLALIRLAMQNPEDKALKEIAGIIEKSYFFYID